MLFNALNVLVVGMIWLNSLSCSGADRLDDCDYRYWSSYSTSCSGLHSDDVGVVCEPGQFFWS